MSKSEKIDIILKQIYEIELNYLVAKELELEDQELIINEIQKMVEFMKAHSPNIIFN